MKVTHFRMLMLESACDYPLKLVRLLMSYLNTLSKESINKMFKYIIYIHIAFCTNLSIISQFFLIIGIFLILSTIHNLLVL